VELIAAEASEVEVTPAGVSPTAIRYAGPVSLAESTHVKSRALVNGTWSALSEAIFAVGPVGENLRISEIMYHPPDTGDPNDPNAEFVELTNVGNETINLSMVRFTNGIEYTFPRFELPAGGHCLLVRDITAFEARYGSTLPVLGQYTGNLNNRGERIELVDAAGAIIHSFEYRDDWFYLTDGVGFSLTIRDPQTDVDPGNESAWRPSAYSGGSPGTDDDGQVLEPGSIVINELLANPDGGASDWIELHNTTSEAIDLGGWYLSDDANDPTRYEIAAGTTLAAGGYLVFSEVQHFGNQDDPGCNTPFGLSKNGETVYLQASSGGVLIGYCEQQEFGESQAGVSLGRWQGSDGECDFVALGEPTPGSANAAPVVGPEANPSPGR
jgi:hypothetical protein